MSKLKRLMGDTSGIDEVKDKPSLALRSIGQIVTKALQKTKFFNVKSSGPNKANKKQFDISGEMTTRDQKFNIIIQL